MTIVMGRQHMRCDNRANPKFNFRNRVAAPGLGGGFLTFFLVARNGQINDKIQNVIRETVKMSVMPAGVNWYINGGRKKESIRLPYLSKWWPN